MYRWPGDIFVNDYNWRQAVGDRDKRPPRENRAYWSVDIESNDFGLDEFMQFCEVLHAEPYVVVSSTGAHDAEMAATEVEYLNGSLNTPMGELRKYTVSSNISIHLNTFFQSYGLEILSFTVQLA